MCTEKNSVNLSNLSTINDIETREEVVRCSNVRRDGTLCNKFLTKAFIFISVSDDIKKKLEENKMSISQVSNGIQIRIGLETKCTRCKNMDYKIEVI